MSLEDMEASYKQWKKDIAYLKDIDAYDFGEAGMISILQDFLPDEAHKEITSKHETTGHKCSTANVSFVEKRDTTKHNAPKDGTSQRVYLTVGGTAYHSCTAKEMTSPTGKESRQERAPTASAKANTRATVLGCTVRSLLTCWKVATQTPKPRDRTLGTIKRTSGNTLACWVRSRRSSQRRNM